jgi:hypothetical protein
MVRLIGGQDPITRQPKYRAYKITGQSEVPSLFRGGADEQGSSRTIIVVNTRSSTKAEKLRKTVCCDVNTGKRSGCTVSPTSRTATSKRCAMSRHRAE